MKGIITSVSKPYEVLLESIDHVFIRQDITVSKSNHTQTVTTNIGVNTVPYKVGDEYHFIVRHITTRFSERLLAIGIKVELGGNYPWIYLDKVNGVLVEGVFQARHGWTAFFMGRGTDCHFSNRRGVFKKIRNMIGKAE